MRKALARLSEFAVLGVILLGSISIFSSPASAQGDEWVESDRGRNFLEWFNPTTETYRQEIFGGPIHTWDGENWVPWIFRDLVDRYEVQHSQVSIQFFDFYSVIWDENLETVKIWNERWVVEYLNKQNKWTDSSFWGITRSYEMDENELRLIRTGLSVIGSRREIYTFRQGSPVKIRIEQTCDSAQTIRFSWRPSGIVATTEKTHKDDENRDSHLTYYDAENNWVGALSWFDELEIVDNIDVTVDEHAQGRKATVTFGNFEVGAGGTAVLDPTVSISSNADAFINLASPNYGHGSSSFVYVGKSGTSIYRTYVSFDLRSIPNNALINSVTLYLRQYPIYLIYSGTHTFGVHRVNDVWSEGTITWNNAPSFTAQETDNISFDITTTGWRSWDVSSDLDSQAIIDNNWVSWCVTAENETDNNRISLSAKDHYISAYRPYLSVQWSPTEPTPYDLKIEGSTSPQRLTTLTPSLSFIYVDNEGDNMENFRVQVGTSAGDNSLWDITTTQENENGDNVSMTYAGTTLSRGTSYFWRVRVQDNGSNWGSYSENENFQINQPPTCSITAPPDGYNAEIDEAIGFTSSATDPDGDTITYSWDFGDLIGTSTLANPSYPYTTSGDYTATLYVNDGYESSATDSILVSVGGGAPPDGNGEDGDGNGDGNGAPGGGGGAGGFVSDVAETVEEFVETHIQPTENLLFQPISFLFGIPLWVPMVGVAGGARAMKKKGKGIFWSVVLVFIFLMFMGMKI